MARAAQGKPVQPSPELVEPDEEQAVPELATPAADSTGVVEVVEEPVERRETFEAVRPDGVVVVVDRNIDTGEQTVTEK